MAFYTITGMAVFGNNTAQTQARGRMETALAAYTYDSATSSLGTGITYPNNTTISVSIGLETNDDDMVRNIRRAIYDAWVGGTRHTSGWLSSNRVG